MPNLTLSIPKELKHEMETIPEFNWSEVARSAISKKIKEYKLFKELVSKSKLTEQGARDLSKRVNEGMVRRLKKEGLL